MKNRLIALSILTLFCMSYSQDFAYSSWFKDPRWNRPIIHSIAWAAGFGVIGGLIGFGYAKANDKWPAYAVGIDVTIGETIGAGTGFIGGLTYGIIRGQSIHKQNMSARGLALTFEF